jgi:glycosyltransferase involved in cell wall biosynthesis
VKICLIVGGALSKLGGLEKHFIELAKGLVKYCEVSVVAHRDYKKYFQDVDIEFIELNLDTSRLNIFLYLKLLSILKKHQFDIVHAQANKAAYIVSKLKKYLPNTRFVATIHNKKKNINYFNTMDFVVGVSNAVLEKIQTKKRVIYNGLDMQKIDSIIAYDLRKAFDVDNTLPVAVSVGRLVEAKGFNLLIEALKDIDINLLIVGDGKEQDNLEAIIKKYGKEKNIKILGFRDDALEIIRSADFVIIASRREGFSYVFAETLCLKKPLLSTDVADVKFFIPTELVIESSNVDLIREKITFYLQNKDKIDFSKYYDEARENFSFENMILKTYQTYEEITGDR